MIFRIGDGNRCSFTRLSEGNGTNVHLAISRAGFYLFNSPSICFGSLVVCLVFARLSGFFIRLIFLIGYIRLNISDYIY